jgi:hypothetical protein
MIKNLKYLTLLALCSMGIACSAEVKSTTTESELKPVLVVKGKYGNENVTYFRYNTEEYPCFKVLLSQTNESKEFCRFTDEIGETIDARTDVSAIAYEDAKFTNKGLQLVIDVSARGPGRFFLDCIIPVSDSSIGEPRCMSRDSDY